MPIKEPSASLRPFGTALIDGLLKSDRLSSGFDRQVGALRSPASLPLPFIEGEFLAVSYAGKRYLHWAVL